MNSHAPSRGIFSRTTPLRPSASNRLRSGRLGHPPAAVDRSAASPSRPPPSRPSSPRASRSPGRRSPLSSNSSHRLLVAVELLRLEVRAVRAADSAPSSQSMPSQRNPSRIGCSASYVALLVGVVDAQDELAAVLAGEQPVEQGGADAADVQVAGGAGGEAGADRGHRHFRGGGDADTRIIRPGRGSAGSPQTGRPPPPSGSRHRSCSLRPPEERDRRSRDRQGAAFHCQPLPGGRGSSRAHHRLRMRSITTGESSNVPSLARHCSSFAVATRPPPDDVRL